MKIIKDKFGPEYIVKVYDPKIGMEGFLIIDNTVLGPGKGGLRMTPDVSEEEVFRLARVMTWKNALAGIPFGGAKAGIKWFGGSSQLKKQYIQSFARAIKLFTPQKYITAPDVNTGEKEMQWFIDATGNRRSATGKPIKKGGLPHELGSTGFGVAEAAKIASELKNINIKETTIAIEGFGNVGKFAFKFLNKMGARIVAVGDTGGIIYNKKGLREQKLLKLKSQRKSVKEYSDGQGFPRSKIFNLPVDILILASVTDIINESNKNKIKAKIIVEGANIPMKENIENELFKKGILIVPDMIANAGGVISSYAEYQGYSTKKMFEMIERKINKVTKLVLEESLKSNKNPREVALKIAKAKIEAKIN